MPAAPLDLDEILEARRRYGWAVVLFGDENKNPSICGEWRDIREQSDDELRALFERVKGRARNWGPICGLDNLFSFDFDWPWVYALWTEKMGPRANTLTYQTPNSGQRVFYRVQGVASGDPFKNTLHLEFKGKHFVAVGGETKAVDGTMHPYKPFVDAPILEDDTIIYDTIVFMEGLLSGRYRWLKYKCIQAHLAGKAIRLDHDQSLAINILMLINGCSDEEIHLWRKSVRDSSGQFDYKPGETDAQIRSGRDFIAKGGLPKPCVGKDGKKGLVEVFKWDPALCGGCSRRTHLEKTTTPPGTYISLDEMSLEALDEVRSTTIKRDKATKLITFLATLLNYTESDQQNIAYSGPAALGKTYNALETTSYFPEEDVYPIAYSSPQAFFHTQGQPVDRDLNPLPRRRDYVDDSLEKWEVANPKPEAGEGRTEWREKRAAEIRRLRSTWDEIEKYQLVDLDKRILIFLDMPHDELLQRLRPLLSHDKKILPIQITDRTKEGGHRTKNVILKGFPTVLFLAVNTSLEGQERTRNFLLSPEIGQEKLKESIELVSKVLSDRKAQKQRIENDMERKKLKARVRAIKGSGISEILIPEEDRSHITEKFLKEHNPLQPRHQRDFPRLIALSKAHALLNFANRRREDDKIWATRDDCDEGYRLYKEVSEANEAELPPHVFKFWVESLREKISQGLSRKEVANLYREFYKLRIGDKALKKLIITLSEAGLVYEDKDPDDRRFTKIYVLGGEGEKSTQAGSPPADPLLSDLLPKALDIGLRLQREKGEAVSSPDVYKAFEAELSLSDSDIQRVLDQLQRDEKAYYPTPYRIGFVGGSQ